MGINFLEPILLDGLDSIMWPLCRVGGFMMTFVTFSGSSVPRNVRALLALAVTVCFLPNIPAIDSNLEAFSGLGIITTISQVLIGAGLGFMTQYLVASFVLAGQAIAMQTGLGFASLVDPVSGTNAPVVGQFFTVLCTLVFFAVDGHLVFIRLLLLSFETLPVGPGIFTPPSLESIIYFGATMFQCALSTSIAAICTLLVVNFTFGVMTRAAPQLNVFSMGFAVSMTVGLFILLVSLDAFMINFTIAINALMKDSCTLIGTGCEGVFQLTKSPHTRAFC